MSIGTDHLLTPCFSWARAYCSFLEYWIELKIDIMYFECKARNSMSMRALSILKAELDTFTTACCAERTTRKDKWHQKLLLMYCSWAAVGLKISKKIRVPPIARATLTLYVFRENFIRSSKDIEKKCMNSRVNGTI